MKQYEDALRKSGFKPKLTYKDSLAPENRNMINRKRKIIWFSSSYTIKMCQQISPKYF